MSRPAICGSIVSENLEVVEQATQFVDLFEVRIDLIGAGWPNVVRRLSKPWIACNRRVEEGGSWPGDEHGRVDELYRAVEIGADIVDVELATTDLEKVISAVKPRAQCLLSFHDVERTPPFAQLKGAVDSQLCMGADICKVVTTAHSFDDSLTVLRLVREFSHVRLLAFAMGPQGVPSRILCPLVGGEFTFASLAQGRESAPGQVTAARLRAIYEMMGSGH